MRSHELSEHSDASNTDGINLSESSVGDDSLNTKIGDSSVNQSVLEMRSSNTSSDSDTRLMLEGFSLDDSSSTKISDTNNKETEYPIEGDLSLASNSDNNIDSSRDRLEKSLQLSMDRLPDFMPRRLDSIKENMERFEQRAKTGEISPTNVIETYNQVDRILNGNATVERSDIERVVLADNVLESASNPQGIDQGMGNTCTITALEAKTYTKNPSKAAEIVADVALTGKHETSYMDPKTGKNKDLNVEIDTTPFNESELYPTPEGRRNYASQLFQVTTANMTLRTQSPHYKYAQVQPAHPYDSGERFYSRDIPEQWSPIIEGVESPPNPAEAQGTIDLADPLNLTTESTIPLKTDEIIDSVIEQHSDKALPEHWQVNFQPNLKIANLALVDNIINENDDPILLGSNEHTIMPENEGNANWEKKIQTIPNLDTLTKVLDNADKNGTFPLLVGVDSSVEPFRTAGEGAGGAGAGHMVSITGILKDGAGKMHALVDNQWGDNNDNLRFDKAIPVEQLFKAIKSN